MMPNVFCRRFGWFVFAMACVGEAHGGYAHFARATDSIYLPTNTALGSQGTYEAIVRLDGDPLGGLVWNEWQNGAEDKQFGVYPPGGEVYGYGVLSSGSTLYAGTTSAGIWHHIAYVFDGSAERVYLDGQVVASRAASGSFSNGNDSIMVIGAIRRNNNNVLYDALRGDIGSVRISGVARYGATPFTPTLDDFVADGSTLLLYNLNDGVGSPTAYDSGPQHVDGLPGATPSFFDVTAPVFVTELQDGDANGDGRVDGDDYARIDRGFQQHLSGKSNGDFNGDNVVDARDYLIIDKVTAIFGPGLSPDLLARREVEFGAAYVSGLVASVPEPAPAIGVTGAAAMAVVTRPRRRAWA